MISLEVKEQEKTTQTTSVTPLLLTPVSIQKMIDLRQKSQVVKFRTTCADCLPNY